MLGGDGWQVGGGGMWEEVVGAALWISVDVHWIRVDILHVDLHLFVFCVLGLEVTFWDDFHMILHGFAWES